MSCEGISPQGGLAEGVIRRFGKRQLLLRGQLKTEVYAALRLTRVTLASVSFAKLATLRSKTNPTIRLR
jgi:hypothetical protein